MNRSSRVENSGSGKGFVHRRGETGSEECYSGNGVMHRLEGTRGVDWIGENAEEARRGNSRGFAKAARVRIHRYLCKQSFVEGAKCKQTESQDR